MRVIILGGVRQSRRAGSRSGVEKIVAGLCRELPLLGLEVSGNTGDVLGLPPALAAGRSAPLPAPPPDAPLARLVSYNVELVAALCAIPGLLVVNVHDLKAALAASLTRRIRPDTVLVTSMAGTVSGRYGPDLDGWFGYLAGIERDLVTHSDLVTVPGSAHQAEVVSALGIDPVRVVDVGIGIDLPPGPALVPSRHPRQILYAGRLAPEKGVLDLLAALLLLRVRRPDVLLQLAGDGPLATEIAARIADAGLSASVRIGGWLERDALWRAYAQAAVCVVPSHYDPYPAVIPEALAAGCAVVGCRTGGIAELLDHGRLGWLVPAGDPERLAEAIDAALSQGTPGTGAPSWVEGRFSWSAFARRMVAAYEQALAAGHSSGGPAGVRH